MIKNDKLYIDSKRIIDFIEEIKNVCVHHQLSFYAYKDYIYIFDFDADDFDDLHKAIIEVNSLHNNWDDVQSIVYDYYRMEGESDGIN